jgi:transcriptional regulator with XRE-family HTH domain
MNELSVGLWLRRERERRQITLQHIANQTKVAVPLLEGLETGDLSRWPGGIYRRAFVKSYATALGLDAEAVLKRVEAEHPPEPDEPALPVPSPPSQQAGATPGRNSEHVSRPEPQSGQRARVLGTAADLTVALVLGLGSAAAGSRLLWPVLFIALYYAVGVLLTGTSPMVALLSHEPAPEPRRDPKPSAAPAPEASAEDARAAQRPAMDRRSRRIGRAQRASSKASRPRVQ